MKLLGSDYESLVWMLSIATKVEDFFDEYHVWPDWQPWRVPTEFRLAHPTEHICLNLKNVKEFGLAQGRDGGLPAEPRPIAITLTQVTPPTTRGEINSPIYQLASLQSHSHHRIPS